MHFLFFAAGFNECLAAAPSGALVRHRTQQVLSSAGPILAAHPSIRKDELFRSKLPKRCEIIGITPDKAQWLEPFPRQLGISV